MKVCYAMVGFMLGCGGEVATQAPTPPASTSSVAPPLPDAPPSTPTDAGAVCAVEASYPSDDCKVGDACSVCSTGREYFCRYGSPRRFGTADIRCDRLEDVGGLPHYCCEAACVRRSSTDATCADAAKKNAYECPNDGSSRSLVGPPAPSCILVEPDISPTHPRIYCCD